LNLSILALNHGLQEFLKPVANFFGERIRDKINVGACEWFRHCYLQTFHEEKHRRIILSEQSKEPLYIQIYQQLKAKIVSGDLEEHTKLPSTRSLAETLKVGRNTVSVASADRISLRD